MEILVANICFEPDIRNEAFVSKRLLNGSHATQDHSSRALRSCFCANVDIPTK